MILEKRNCSKFCVEMAKYSTVAQWRALTYGAPGICVIDERQSRQHDPLNGADFTRNVSAVRSSHAVFLNIVDHATEMHKDFNISIANIFLFSN